MTDGDLPSELDETYRSAVSRWARQEGIQDADNFSGEVIKIALEAWRNMPPDGKVPPEKRRGWIWTIAKYEIRNAIRRKQDERTRIDVLQAAVLPQQAHARDPADEVVSRLDLEQSWRLLDAVDEPDRSILRLLWDGKSAQEIADDLDLTRGQVAMRIVRINKYFQHDGPHPRPRKALDDLRSSFETGES